MLKIKMSHLSERELEGVVTEHCSCFGAVKKLKIYLPRNGSRARSFALVDMETPQAAARLAAAMGQLTLDNAVVIFLQQEAISASVLLQARSSSDVTVTYPPLITD